MAAHYVNISESDIHQFLTPQGFKRIMVEGTVEIVYGKRVYQDDLQLTLRVYTGIDPSGHSRAVGKDAIRVNLFMRHENRTMLLGGSKRVHRVAGWRDNLQDRLDSWLEYFPKQKCKCGFPMVPRKSKKTKETFLGCSNFPICRETKEIE